MSARAFLAPLTLTLTLTAGCEVEPAQPPPEQLASSELSYVISVDWEDSPVEQGEQIFVTDLGYTVGLRSWRNSLTNVELIPCEWFRHFGHDHDVSQLELQWNEELVQAPHTWELGSVPGAGLPYCGLYQIMGTVSVDDAEPELVTAMSGWYQIPGSSLHHAFEVEAAVPLAFLPRLGEGTWDPALLLGEGRVEMVWQPVRAFDGLELDTLSELDLAFFTAQNLGRGVQVLWSIGEL